MCGLVVEHGLHCACDVGGLRERALRLRHRRGGRGRLVRMHVAQREDAIVQRVRIRTARAPRATPADLTLLREYLLHVKRKATQPHVPSPAVRYHELHCNKIPDTVSDRCVIKRCMQ